MGVSRADQKKADDVSRIREEYELRETEAAKKKREELKYANERHQKELQSLKESYEKRIAELQQENREGLSEKDYKHYKEVEDLRSAYRDQSRRKAEQSNFEKKVLTDTYESQIEKEKAAHELSKKTQTENQMNELRKRDGELENITAKAAEKIRENTEHRNNTMKAKFEEEKESLLSGRDAMLDRKELELKETRKALKGELRAEKQKRENVESQWKQKYYDTVNSLGENSTDDLLDRGAAYKESLDDMRERFRDTLDDRTEKMEANQEDYQNKMNSRYNEQVRTRDAKIRELKNDLVREDNKHRKQSSNELKNVIQNYEKRMELLNQDRDAYMDEVNERVRERIDHVQNKNNEVLRDTVRDYKTELQLTNTRNRLDRKLLLEQTSEDKERLKSQTDMRVAKVQKFKDQTEKMLMDRYDNNLDEIKEGYKDRIETIRDKSLDAHAKLNSILSKKVRGLEENYQERLDGMKAEYEKQLAAMREDHRKEVFNIEKRYKTFVQDKEKGHKTEKEALEMRYAAKIEAIEEEHQKDKHITNKKHEEDMRNLANRLSGYDKKA